ncbi:uncharacterized protein [Acropora muricata]|uniref:uncharacterized protein n=1 Tax=Acropora muricata TaxID=159855 RepID=UPI0034E3EB36
MTDELPFERKFENLHLGKGASKQEQENEAQENRQQTPERGKDTKKKAIPSQRKLFPPHPEAENYPGKWLLNHPWQDERPDPEVKIDNTIQQAAHYPLLEQWKSGKTVHLRRGYDDLPEFVSQMRRKKEFEMLKEYMNAKTEEDKKSKMTPHMKEIEDDEEPRDKPSSARDQSLKAYSLDPTKRENQQEKRLRYLDCEYMLKMYLPENRTTWFKHENPPPDLIRTINSDKKDKRWIFIPSFRRSKIALLDWPEDEIVTEESTIRILVVRPCQFEDYVERCGHTFPIISLPNDEIGAGYARFWIQKIAMRLKLDFIWMIDDSVECFYEYHPNKKPNSFSDQRRRQFGLVFERIEGFVKPAANIAAMSPRGGPPGRPVSNPFTRKPPIGAVYLNVKALKEKEVFYRPELKVFEDMMFGYECFMNRLNVFRDNRVQLEDHDWKHTGAMSPSVRPPKESE